MNKTEVQRLKRQIITAYIHGKNDDYVRLFDHAARSMSDRDFESVVIEIDKIDDEAKRRERAAWNRDAHEV